MSQVYSCQREGTAGVFCAFGPLANRRGLRVTGRRAMADFAHSARGLADGRYGDAERVVLVMDNLDTHSLGSLYEAFAPDEAERVAERLEVHHTPKHGCRLNVAEVELSVPGKRLKERVGGKAGLVAACAAFERERNRAGKGVDGQFTTADARVKLARLYPTIELSRTTSGPPQFN